MSLELLDVPETVITFEKLEPVFAFIDAAKRGEAPYSAPENTGIVSRDDPGNTGIFVSSDDSIVSSDHRWHGGRAFVHCNDGCSRAPTVAIA